MVTLLIAAAIVTTILGDLPDTLVIVLVGSVNTVIGVVQEVRADQAIAALDRLAAPTARVVRDGTDQIVPAAELVRDDLVRLEAGDIVPADLALTEAERAAFDESALTGESVPAHRAPGEDAAAGTVLTTGRAVGIVMRTGARSSLGRISDLVARTRPGQTPLQRRLAALSRTLGAAAVTVSTVVFALGVLAGQPVVRMAITAVSLVVAAVPESLPAVVTLALALGARRMARTRAIPRRLHAVETLGSVTVIASDKTGTLTENRMAVQRAVTPDGTRYGVTGTGYGPAGEIRRDDVPVSAADDLRDLARAGLLCNDADLAPPGPGRPEWTAVGDPMEAALLAFLLGVRQRTRPAVRRAPVRRRHAGQPVERDQQQRPPHLPPQLGASPAAGHEVGRGPPDVVAEPRGRSPMIGMSPARCSSRPASSSVWPASTAVPASEAIPHSAQATHTPNVSQTRTHASTMPSIIRSHPASARRTRSPMPAALPRSGSGSRTRVGRGHHSRKGGASCLSLLVTAHPPSTYAPAQAAGGCWSFRPSRCWSAS